MDVSAVTDRNDQDKENFIGHLIDDAVVAHPNSIEIGEAG